ncbi:hypothetical protein FB45DRAFT_889999 [Roridomyces roridus]|uniref:Fork-head domain-containing protein n=1 Tax=Roridomyces roridus TaxID=1738132 RepID=A0AAD7CKS2_9AGAR|nr:hypothetical protein FB45DRAFT_889999 [Roridomyces roridus]
MAYHHDWRMAGDSLPYHRVPTRSGSRPDDSQPAGHGGNIHRHGSFHTTTPDGGFQVDDDPYVPSRDHHGHQFVNPTLIFHDDAQHFGPGPRQNASSYYRQDVGEQSLQPYGRASAPVPPPIHHGGHHHNQHVYHAPHTHSTMPTALPPSAFHQSNRRDEAGEDLRRILNLGPNDPVNLWSIPDTGARPTVPGSLLCKLAIYGSPNKQLTLQEIYAELIQRFKWFNVNRDNPAWKNSIRHLLSLYHPFENVPRPVTAPGKGNYWWLDYSKGGANGYKRERKRRARSKRAEREEEDPDVDESEYDIFGGDPGESGSEGRGSPDARGSGGGGGRKPHISRVQSMPMIVDGPSGSPDPHFGHFGAPVGQYGVDYGPVLRGTHPGHRHTPTPGPGTHMMSSFRPETPGRVHVDVKPTLEELQAREGRQLRPRPSQSHVHLAAARAMSPTDQAYAKSRRHARPG